MSLIKHNYFRRQGKRLRARLRAILLTVTSMGMLLTACAPAASSPAVFSTPTIFRQGRLTPYLSPTAPANAAVNGTVAVNSASTPTPRPSPTSTPRTHVVKKGEDMGGIAWQYRVSIEELMAANPTVQPNMMSVGTRLVIPASKTPMPSGATGGNPSAEAPTPTAIPVEIGRMRCERVEDGGVWCFLPVQNTRTVTLEGLSAVFHLSGQQAQTVVSQDAFLPLDTLPPGVSLPLAAYFSPIQVAALTPPYQFSSEMRSTLPSAKDGRYLPAQIENSKVNIAENGLSAELSADVLLKEGNAERVWVAAVAYDAQGNVVGMRRWEKTDARLLEHGQASEITMSVYSISARIERVEVVAEARP